MLRKRKTIERQPYQFDMDGFPDYTKKEIFLQCELIKELVNRNIKAGRINLDYLKIKADRLKHAYIISDPECYCFALMGAYNFEALADIQCTAELVSEFCHSNPILDKSTIVIALCRDNDFCAQARKRAEDADAKFVGIFDFAPDDKSAISIDFVSKSDVPTASATLKGVALIMLLLYIGERADVLTQLYIKIALKNLLQLGDRIKAVLQNEYELKQISTLVKNKALVFTGTGVDFAVSIYASYIFNKYSVSAPAVPLGALDSIGVKYDICVLFVSDSEFYSLLGERQVSLVIAPRKIHGLKNALYYDESIPLLNPIISSICLQLIVYHMVDQDAENC